MPLEYSKQTGWLNFLIRLQDQARPVHHLSLALMVSCSRSYTHGLFVPLCSLQSLSHPSIVCPLDIPVCPPLTFLAACSLRRHRRSRPLQLPLSSGTSLAPCELSRGTPAAFATWHLGHLAAIASASGTNGAESAAGGCGGWQAGLPQMIHESVVTILYFMKSPRLQNSRTATHIIASVCIQNGK
jgi:hypothetical protein